MIQDSDSDQLGVGVIVGRFQIDELTAGHVSLFDAAERNHAMILAVLGSSPVRNTRRCPLDFESRRQMIAARYPDARIVELMDAPIDSDWVRSLDNIIQRNTPPGVNITLYGGRDSFIQCYNKNNGKYKTVEVPYCGKVSGTSRREHVALQSSSTGNHRRGVISAAYSRYPAVVMCVDIAPLIEKNDGMHVVMIKKHEDGGKLRFIGGHVEPSKPRDYESSDLLELNAIREAKEEANVTMRSNQLTYLGSALIPDWRYHGEADVIASAFFAGVCFDPIDLYPGDDADGVKVVHLNSITSDDVIAEHHTLLKVLNRYVINRGSTAQILEKFGSVGQPG